MTEVVSWEETPAALLRNRGLTVRKDIADLAAEVASPDRAEAHRAFRESWAPVLTVQEALAKRGWPGAFITVPGPLHNQDLEGGRVILDNGNLRLTAAALANILAGVLEDWTDDPAGAFALLREHHAGGR